VLIEEEVEVRSLPWKPGCWEARSLCALASFVVAGGLLASSAVAVDISGGSPRASEAGSRCQYRVYQPFIQNNHILSRASWRCTSPHRRATATVILERLSAGKWKKIKTVTKHLDVLANRSYALQAATPRTPPTAPCGITQPKMTMRTYFALDVSPTRIVYTTPSVKLYPPCPSG
jgi:hypothetical protein